MVIFHSYVSLPAGIYIYIRIYITYSAAAIHMGFTGMNHPGTTGRPFDNPAWISHGFFLDVQWLYGTWFPFFFPNEPIHWIKTTRPGND